MSQEGIEACKEETNTRKVTWQDVSKVALDVNIVIDIK